MPQIFLNYRRTDTAGHAGRLYDRLAERFGHDGIFMDIDAVQPGEDFVARIEDVVANSDLVVALIGREWLWVGRGFLRRGRLQGPSDFVRIELQVAFERGLHVIPVLVEGATMPTPAQLPGAIGALARRQAFELSDARWRSDCDRLIAAMERLLESPQPDRLSPDRQASERGSGVSFGATAVASPTRVTNLLSPGHRVGGYRVQEEIGRGGHGIVYSATPGPVALKVMAPQKAADEGFVERLRHETALVAGLDHSHVIPIHDVAGEDGLVYVVMMRADGDILGGHRGVLALLAQSADALDFAHRSGVVHGGLTPPNILVRGGDHAYLSDFGLTQADASSRLTRASSHRGVLEYLAPERLRGHGPTPESDRYALAAIAYAAITGVPPFAGHDRAALLYALLNEVPAPPSVVNDTVPPAADAVLLGALAKDPDARPGEADEFVRPLVAAFDERPRDEERAGA